MLEKWNHRAFEPGTLLIHPVDNMRLKVGTTRQFHRAYLEPDRLPDWGYGDLFEAPLESFDDENSVPEARQAIDMFARVFEVDRHEQRGVFIRGFSAAHRVLEMQARDGKGNLVEMWPGVAVASLGRLARIGRSVSQNGEDDQDGWATQGGQAILLTNEIADSNARIAEYVNGYYRVIDRHDNVRFRLTMLECFMKEDMQDPRSQLYYLLGNAVAYDLFFEQLSMEYSLTMVAAAQHVQERPAVLKGMPPLAPQLNPFPPDHDDDYNL